jgi:hypothetical protein
MSRHQRPGRGDAEHQCSGAQRCCTLLVGCFQPAVDVVVHVGAFQLGGCFIEIDGDSTVLVSAYPPPSCALRVTLGSDSDRFTASLPLPFGLRHLHKGSTSILSGALAVGRFAGVLARAPRCAVVVLRIKVQERRTLHNRFRCDVRHISGKLLATWSRGDIGTMVTTPP